MASSFDDTFGDLMISTTAVSFTNESLQNSSPTSTNLFGKIYYPTIACVGIIGNISNIIIMSRPSMRKYSSSIYLLGLAVADILVVTFGATLKYSVFKAWVVTSPRWFHEYLCVYNSWLIVSSNRLTWLITMAFTVERFIVVAFPMKYKRIILSVKNTKVILYCNF